MHESRMLAWCDIFCCLPESWRTLELWRILHGLEDSGGWDVRVDLLASRVRWLPQVLSSSPTRLAIPSALCHPACQASATTLHHQM